MFTDLASIRTAVKDRLTPLLPSGWKFEPTLEGTVKALTPVLYIEFVRVDTRQEGAPLGAGQVLASFNLIITDPKTDTAKAEDAVDSHLVPIIRALDSFDDLYWENTEKRRLQDGPLAWIVQAFAFVKTIETEE